MDNPDSADPFAQTDANEDARPQLHRWPTSQHTTTPLSPSTAAPRDAKSPFSLRPTEANLTNPNNNHVQELQQEIQCLERVIDKIDQEKRALKMRLNEIEYFQKFQVQDCKKWLQANFDFDRKDTPALLAGMFEDYLLQNDDMDPLPHQLIVKNSSRAQRQRGKRIQNRSIWREKKRESPSAVSAPAAKKHNSKGSERDLWNTYIHPGRIRRLYENDPWTHAVTKWTKSKSVLASIANSKARDLFQLQDDFIKENGCAIWERSHWLPIKQDLGKNDEEVKELCYLHSKRKRRQSVLKANLEKIAKSMARVTEKSALEQSIFSSRGVETILQRPRLWIPKEGEELIDQLHALDSEEPDRNVLMQQAVRLWTTVILPPPGPPSAMSATVTATADHPPSSMAEYLQRYDHLHQQRQRQRQHHRQLADTRTSNTPTKAEEKMETTNNHQAQTQEDEFASMPALSDVWTTEMQDPTNAFDLPSRENVFTGEQQDDFAGFGEDAFHSDEFVDAVTFLEKNELGGNDSFSQDVNEFQPTWGPQNDNDADRERGRPSDFFEKKSRDLNRVEFSSPERKRTETDNAGRAEPPPGDSFYGSSFELSQVGTALSSSGYDVHFDTHRLVYTPNSLKYLQEKHRTRNNQRPSIQRSIDEPVDHEQEAHQLAVKTQQNSNADLSLSEDLSKDSIEAMQRGPDAIREALQELDALVLRRPSPRKVPRGMSPSDQIHEVIREYDNAADSGLPMSRTTDSWGDDGISAEDFVRDLPNEFRQLSVDPRPMVKYSELDTICESPQTFEGGIKNASPPREANDDHSLRQSHLESGDMTHLSENRDQSTIRAYFHSKPNPIESEKQDMSFDRENLGDEDYCDQRNLKDDDRRSDPRIVHPSSEAELENNRLKAAYNRRHIIQNGDYMVRDAHLRRDNNVKKLNREPLQSAADMFKQTNNKKYNIKHMAAMNPVQLSRRCRRLLCSVGETMIEQIVFSNGTDSIGRICVSLLPLSTGCQQFTISPAVLELKPRSSGSFHISFHAQLAGVVAAIFQFRGIGTDSLFNPYEVLIETSVRRSMVLKDADSSVDRATLIHRLDKQRQVQELHSSGSVNAIEIGPTFVEFECAKNKNGDKIVQDSRIRIVNNTANVLPFKVLSTHEHFKVRPVAGVIQPASESYIMISALSQPFIRHSRTNGAYENRTVNPERWCGSFSIQVGTDYSREISVVCNRKALAALPPFEEIARSRHHISSQTDSFYYTKRKQRRGLYFHARAVECGSCRVGESHQVPVYICNGSNSPMTVFLQELSEPFSCSYTTTTIQAKKFIEVFVSFTPKVAGKVSTSLFAYSVNDKAVVTLVARGI